MINFEIVLFSHYGVDVLLTQHLSFAFGRSICRTIIFCGREFVLEEGSVACRK